MVDVTCEEIADALSFFEQPALGDNNEIQQKAGTNIVEPGAGAEREAAESPGSKNSDGSQEGGKGSSSQTKIENNNEIQQKTGTNTDEHGARTKDKVFESPGSKKSDESQTSGERSNGSNQTKPLTEVVSKSGEIQNKLFATPPTIGKKSQPGTHTNTSELLAGFTADNKESAQPDMFAQTTAEPTAEPVSKIEQEIHSLSIDELSDIFDQVTGTGQQQETVRKKTKSEQHETYLRKKLALAKHPDDKKKYRQTLQNYLKKLAEQKQKAAETTTPVDTTPDVNVAYNEERNGIELRFAARPANDVIAKVKAAGFKWSGKQKLWYAKKTDARQQFADELSGKGLAQGENARSLSSIIEDVAALGVKGADEALKGLYELFGGSAIKAFPGAIDETTYAKAKPHFTAAFNSFSEAGKGIKEFFKVIADRYGVGIKPYLMRFVEDVKNNDVDIQRSDAVNANDNREGEENANTHVQRENRGVRAGDDSSAMARNTDSKPNQDAGTSTEGQSTKDIQTAESKGNIKEVSEEQRGGDVRAVSGRSGQSKNKGDAAGVSRSSVIRGSTARGGSDSMGRSSAKLDGVQRSGRDHRIPLGGLKREGSWKTTAKRNLDIVKISLGRKN
ncbi:MAG: hypothetical protein RBQ99_07355 [Trichlorobacter sp.]|nr:hypothetical protein [Trichlorobacter sp.]